MAYQRANDVATVKRLVRNSNFRSPLVVVKNTFETLEYRNRIIFYCFQGLFFDILPHGDCRYESDNTNDHVSRRAAKRSALSHSFLHRHFARVNSLSSRHGSFTLRELGSCVRFATMCLSKFLQKEQDNTVSILHYRIYCYCNN